MLARLIEKFADIETTYRNDLIDTRRRFMRYDGTGAEVMLAGRPYNIRDWSLGGVLFDTPRHDWNTGGAFYEAQPVPHLQAGDDIRAALRFRVMEQTVEIMVDMTVVSVDARGVSARFLPLSTVARQKFARVMDLQNAEKFLSSQSVN